MLGGVERGCCCSGRRVFRRAPVNADGILDPSTHYYRRLMSDAARAVEAARALPDVDAERIVVAGGSQGGGLSLAAAGLSEGLAGSLPDVPFLCHYRRATEITGATKKCGTTRSLMSHDV